MKTYLVIAALFFSGCTLLQKPEPPKVTLKQVRVEEINLKGARLIFDLEAFNPNTRVLAVDSVNYNLELNAKPVTDGSLQNRIELKAKETSQVSIPIQVEFAKVFDSILSALQKPKADYRIFGHAKVSGFTVPFEEKGTLEWQKQQ